MSYPQRQGQERAWQPPAGEPGPESVPGSEPAAADSTAAAAIVAGGAAVAAVAAERAAAASAPVRGLAQERREPVPLAALAGREAAAEGRQAAAGNGKRTMMEEGGVSQ